MNFYYFKINTIGKVYAIRVCGAMDNASDYESGDCRFDPCQTRFFAQLNEEILKSNYVKKDLEKDLKD
jgi:hypothetical protein